MSEIRQLCKNQNYDIIVIDYLQLVKADKTYANRASEVGDISKAIKDAVVLLTSSDRIMIRSLRRREKMS